MDKFTRQYFETALWSSTDNSDDSGGEPLDKNYSTSDIGDETRDKMIADCADFQERFGELYSDSEQAGHDFWLSRNGHGTGFFDSDEEHSDKLQDAAESYGEFDLYIGDDGEIHGSPLESRGARERPRVARGLRSSGHRVSDFDIAIIQRTGRDWVVAVYKDGDVVDGARAGTILDIEGWLKQKYPDIPSETRTEKSAFQKKSEHTREAPHRVSDFNTIPALIEHAHQEGATHVHAEGDETRLYFPHPQHHGYHEEARIYRERGYWHVPAQSDRRSVNRLPHGAKPIEGVARGRGRRAAEKVSMETPRFHSDVSAAIESWNRGDAYRDGSLQTLIDARLVAHGRRGWEPTASGQRRGLEEKARREPERIASPTRSAHRRPPHTRKR